MEYMEMLDNFWLMTTPVMAGVACKRCGACIPTIGWDRYLVEKHMEWHKQLGDWEKKQ